MSIETEHLLTGLLREGKGIAGRLLSTPPLSPDAIRLGLQRRVQVRDPRSTSVEIPFSEETKRVLVVLPEHNEATVKSFRNIPGVEVRIAPNREGVGEPFSTRDLLVAHKVLVAKDAMTRIEEAWTK